MARTVEWGEYKATRTDNGIKVDPRALVVDFGTNLSRGGAAIPVDADLKILANSMLPKDDQHPERRGQQQAIKGRMLKDRRVQVYEGFRRTAAALWLVEQGHEFQILVNITEVSDIDAAIDNLVENKNRLAPEPIDYGNAMRFLRDNYGMKGKEIALRLGRSQPYVNQLLEMVDLAAPVIKAAVASKELSANAATAIVKASGGDTQEQVKLFDAAKASGGKKVSATTIKAAKARSTDAKINAGDVATGVQVRSSKAMRGFISALTGKDEHPQGRAIASLILATWDGKKTEEQFQRGWYKVFAPEVAEAK